MSFSTYSVRISFGRITWAAIVFSVWCHQDKALADEAPWELKKQSNGISVYSQELPGMPINSIRAVAELAIAPSDLLALLSDVTKRPAWNSMCIIGERLADINDGEQVYFVYDMPWPVADRDLVMTMSPDESEWSLKFTAVESNYRRTSNAVRVSDAWERWDLQPVAGGALVTMTVFMDPAGPIPTWLINSMSTSQPYDVMERLRTYASSQYAAQ